MPGGFIYKPSRKDYLADKVPTFGLAQPVVIKPLGRLEELLASPLAKISLYQGDIPSCVTCASTFINMWNSWKEHPENASYLSWPYLYASVKRYDTGTIPQDVLNILRKEGQCEDSFFPQETYWMPGSEFFLDQNRKSSEAQINAEKYKISGYFELKNKSPERIFNALRQSPVMLGVWVNSGWHNQGVIQPGPKEFLHMTALIDVDEMFNWIVVSWDKKDGLDIKTLHRDYPIVFAGIIRDLPDNFKPEDARRGFFLENYFKNIWT